jgi:hypothetical protein
VTIVGNKSLFDDHVLFAVEVTTPGSDTQCGMQVCLAGVPEAIKRCVQQHAMNVLYHGTEEKANLLECKAALPGLRHQGRSESHQRRGPQGSQEDLDPREQAGPEGLGGGDL